MAALRCSRGGQAAEGRGPTAGANFPESADVDLFKQNNFDLVRLVAASQVMLLHSMVHLKVPADIPRTLVAQLPGVPAFFFISGLLISASWERNPDLRTFTVNRALRIFPALYGVLLFSLLTLLIFYDRGVLAENLGKLLLWSICQVTLLQDWNPQFLRGYGVGGVNGSLWTIPVELSFYAFIPFIYLACRHFRSSTVVLASITAVSFGIQIATYAFQHQMPELLFKLITKTPLPWVGMFCVGIMAQRALPKLYPLVAGRFPLFLALYVILAALAWRFPVNGVLRAHINNMGVINFIALCALVLSMAYTKRDLAERWLRRNDISYGVYIFHMPVINVFVHAGLTGWVSFSGAVLASVCFALGSWFLIEKPSLGLRHRMLYQR